MALCRCSPFYQLAKDFTQAWAFAFVAKLLVGQFGRYLQVRKSASERGGSVCLNRFRAFLKWFSALVTPLPRLAAAD
jgi:hypothetical protein